MIEARSPHDRGRIVVRSWPIVAAKSISRDQNQGQAGSPRLRPDRHVIVARSPHDPGQDQARSCLP